MRSIPENTLTPRRGVFLFAAAVFAPWFLVFNQLRVEWSINPQYSYGWVVPLLTLYLFSQRWATRPAALSLRSGWAIAMAAVSIGLLLPLRWLQEANPDWRLVLWAMAFAAGIGASCFLVLAGGWSWGRHFLVPVFFPLLAVPWPTSWEYSLVQELMRVVAEVSVEVLQWCGVAALRRGNLIELGNGVVGINEACSGVRSLQATLMASIFLAEICGFRTRERFFLVAAGGFFALLGNFLRAAVLAGLAASYGPEFVTQWHDPAGYGVLFVSFAGLLGSCRLLKRTGSSEQPPRAEAMPLANYFPASKVMFGTVILWLGLVELTTEGWYRWHERNESQPIAWHLRWPEEIPGFAYRALPAETKAALRFDEGNSAVWQSSDGVEWLSFFLRWSGGKSAAQLARVHSPAACLSASGLEYKGESEPIIISQRQLILRLRCYAFRLGQKELYVFYCLTDDAGSPAPQSLADDLSYRSRFRACWVGRRQKEQRMLEIAIAGVKDPAEASARVKEFLEHALVTQDTPGFAALPADRAEARLE